MASSQKGEERNKKSELLCPPSQTRNPLCIRASAKKVCFTFLSAESGAWGSRVVFRKNWVSRNGKMLVVWTSRVVCCSPLRRMQKMEKRKKSSQERASKAGNRMATATREKVASQFTSKQQAVRPLLRYLMTTEVGGLAGEAHRAAEWDQRADREGEELLDSR